MTVATVRNKRLDLAFRLAEHVAHRVDVLAMLDELSEEEFGWWLARDRAVPVGHSVRCNALLTHAVVAFLGGEDFDVLSAEKVLLPWLQYEQHSKQPAAQNKQARQVVNAILDKAQKHAVTR